MAVELKPDMGLESSTQFTSVGSVHEVEPPQPSDVDERLCIGLGKGRVSNTHTNYDMWKETISQKIGSFFNTSDVRVEEIEACSNLSHGRTVGVSFIGEVCIDGVPLKFVAGYFGGQTGVIEEESGLEQNDSLSEAPTWEEVGEWWNDDWGTWEINHPDTLVINDDGMPDSKKRELQEKHRSRVRVSYDSSDTLCTESNAIDDQSNMESKSFNERMNSLADDLDAQAREREEERIKQYLRDNRETFQAEITKVGIMNSSEQIPQMVYVKLDIPTHGSERFEFHTPDGGGSGQRLYEILSYLGADLRHMDMIEGMYLPVAHENDEWAVQLPSDAHGHGPTTWSSLFSTQTIVEPLWSLVCAIPRPSVMGVLCVVGVFIGVIGMAVTPNANFPTDFMFFIVFMLSIIGCVQKLV